MKGKPTVACFLSVILFASAIGLLHAEPAMANIEQASNMDINSDGSITPDIGLIKQNGQTYTMIGNITNYQINIYRSNIVFDGAGYTIKNSAYYQGDGICLGRIDAESTNVTIKDVDIIALSYARSILLLYASDCLISHVTSKNSIAIHGNNNFVNNCIAPISVFEGSGNVISKNNISDLYLGVNGGNYLYLNNIFAGGLDFGSAGNFLDNGSVGNYWADYATRYPNASEIGHTGIWDTTYVINTTSGGSLFDDNSDNYPLVYQYDIENDRITLPPQPTSTSPPAGEDVNESLLTTYALVTVSITIAAVAVGLIYYQRKRKTRYV
jgi:hypothetical protein